MFKNYTYQQKLKGLGVVALLLVVMVYFFAIKKTIAVRSECEEKQRNLELSRNLEARVSEIRMDLAKLERIMGQKNDTNRKVIDLLLESITEYCSKNGCTLRDIPKAMYAKDPNFNIETNVISVEGNYRQLLNLLYLLEQKKKSGGRLSSLYFDTRKNNNTKKLSLELTMYFQEFNKIGNENN